MQAHDTDVSYVRRAVFIMLSVSLVAAVCATAVHWLNPVHRWMDLVIPPTGAVIFTALIVTLARHPERMLGIARINLLVAALALIAPAWFYTLQAVHTPGETLVGVYPPVASVFVVLMMMLMVFIPGRRALALIGLCWLLIALPVLVYLLLHPHELFTSRGTELVMAYGPVVLMVIAIMPVQRGMAGTIRRMTAERVQMESMVHRDPLTGIHNRRLGQRVLEDHVRDGTPAGVIMLDLDHFKAINDTHGHPTGDKVLKAVAERCRGLLREHEILSRWGGEEFLMLLPGLDAKDLLLVAHRLAEGIAQLELAPVGKVTASLGVTMIDPSDRVDTVLERVDQALYRAKRQGGHAVVQIETPTVATQG